MFIESMLSFMMLQDKTFMNVQDVQNLALVTCMCEHWVCIACLNVLHVVFLDETNVGGIWEDKVYIYF